MKNMISKTVFLALLFVCTSCKDEMKVQMDYVSNRDECREKADEQLSNYSTPDSYQINDKEKKSASDEIFCECMKGHDWKVIGCPKPPVVAAKPAVVVAPAVVPVPTQNQAPAAVPAPVPVAAPAPTSTNNTTVLVVQPTPPVVAPTPVAPPTNAPAQYQPASPNE